MQTVTIDLIPQKEKPIVKLSQYDNDRQVRFMLEENGEPYTLTGTETVEVNIRKPDRNIVVIEPTIAANAYVDVLFTEQSAACYGESFGELSIKSGETVTGTCNFIIDVEISPIYGGIASATEINNLETQIEEIITEVLSDDYYTKTETDDLLSAKADASDVYTKTQTDTLLSAKADASDVYTKGQVDTALAGKADVSDLPDMDLYYTKTATDTLLAAKADASTTTAALATKADKSDTYTKEQVDALIDNIFPTFTVSGNIATFTTALIKPLVSITTAEGATTVTRCGANLMHVNSRITQTYQGVTYTSDDNYMYMNGTKYGSTYVTFPLLDITLPAGTYYIKAFPISGTATIEPSIMPYNGRDLTSNILNNERILTLNETTTFHFRFALWTDNSVYTDYKIGIAIGTASISNYSEYTGTTVPVADADELTTIAGVNNIYADSGAVTVQYKYMSM